VLTIFEESKLKLLSEFLRAVNLRFWSKSKIGRRSGKCSPICVLVVKFIPEFDRVVILGMRSDHKHLKSICIIAQWIGVRPAQYPPVTRHLNVMSFNRYSGVIKM